MTSYKLLVLVFALLSLTHYQRTAADDNIVWGQISQGVKSSISTPKKRYQFGEPIRVKYRLKNDSQNVIALSNNDSLIDYDIQITGINLGIVSFNDSKELRKRRPIPMTLFGKKKQQLSTESSLRYVAIAPSKLFESRIDGYDINRLYDLSIAGEYEIVVNRKIVFMGSKNFFIVESNALKIEVIAPEETKILLHPNKRKTNE